MSAPQSLHIFVENFASLLSLPDSQLIRLALCSGSFFLSLSLWQIKDFLRFSWNFFWNYRLEGLLAILKLKNRVERYRISQGIFLQHLSTLLFRSGIAAYAKVFEKQRSRTIFFVSGPFCKRTSSSSISFCKRTSSSSISGHWPPLPGSSAPGLLSLLISGIERLLVE